MQVLALHNVPEEKLKTYDVLEDSELRSGIKEFSCVTICVNDFDYANIHPQ